MRCYSLVAVRGNAGFASLWRERRGSADAAAWPTPCSSSQFAVLSSTVDDVASALLDAGMGMGLEQFDVASFILGLRGHGNGCGR